MHTSNFKKKSRFVTQWRQMRSNDVEMPATLEMFCAVTLRKPPKCPRPPKKILGYGTLARNMPMPTPCFLVLVTLRSASCPSVVYTTVLIIMLNVNNVHRVKIFKKICCIFSNKNHGWMITGPTVYSFYFPYPKHQSSSPGNDIFQST